MLLPVLGFAVHDRCEAGEITVTAVGELTEDPEDAQRFSLNISSTAGGSVTAPGEGVFDYEGGAVVDLVATPEEGYEFAGWTGDVGTIAENDVAETRIVVDDDCSIMASFREEVYEEVAHPNARQPGLWGLIAGMGVLAAGLGALLARRRRITGTTRN